MPQKAKKAKKAKKANVSKTNSSKSSLLLQLLSWQKYFLIFLPIVVVINAIAGYWAHNHWVVETEQRHLLILSTQYAKQQSQVVTQYFDNLHKKTQGLTDSALLINALREKNIGVIERFEDELRNSVAASTWVHIYPRGAAELNADAEQPIRFAELDMINRATTYADVFPEASQVDGKWRIAFVKPLPTLEQTPAEDEQPPAEAVLFMFLSANELLSLLGQSNASQGSTLLSQHFSRGKPQTIVQLGEQGVGDGAEVAIPQSHWRVHFAPYPSLAAQAEVSAIILFLLLGIMFVASIALALFLAKKLGAKFDNSSLVGNSVGEGQGSDKAQYTGSALDNKDLSKVKVREEDSNILGLEQNTPVVDPLDIQDTPSHVSESPDSTPAHIFRAYDIRGDAKTELNPQLVVAIGQATASLALEVGDSSMYVARDGRTHSAEFAELLIEGIVSTGCNVINLGVTPTPLMNFAICEDKQSSSGVMITASHNPANYNGFKIVIDGRPLFDDAIQALRAQISQGKFVSKGTGREENHDITTQYIERIFSDVALAGELTIVVDAGNGVTGKIAPRLLEELGCRVIPLFCDIDGTFPNHDPDPTVDSNLKALIEKVKAEQADIGVALDGDGDRLGIVTANGEIIRADRILMLLAKDIVSRNPGSDVVFDVKSSRELNTVITTYGGRPIMWKSGHSPMKAKMIETQAMVGGELSGHIFIAERWYGFDDGLYATVRILEIMSLRDQSLEDILAGLPNPPSTGEILIPINESKKFNFIHSLIEQAEFANSRITTIDGLRVEFEQGWGLVRASNTSAALTLRFEADTLEIMHDIQQQFKYQMLKVDNDLIIAFD